MARTTRIRFLLPGRLNPSDFMRNKFGILFTLLFCLASRASAADLITVVIQTTNGTVSGNSVTLQGSLRYGTNAISGSTWVTNASPAQSSTNLLQNLTLSPISLAWSVQQTNTNTIVIYGAAPLTASISSGWGILTLYTNAGTNHHAFMLPYKSIPTATRTNDVSDVLESIGSSVPTNTVPPTAPAFAAFINSTTSQTGSNKTWVGGVLNGNRSTNVIGLHGTNYSLYGGLYTSPRLLSPNTTNLVNQGNAISSIGSGSSSEQFGSGAAASGTSSTALGNASIASADFSTALGWAAEADGLNDVAIGAGAGANGGNAVAVGTGAAVTVLNGIAIGTSASALFVNSAAFGYAAAATTSNQVRIGSSTHTVSIPGTLEATLTTNSTVGGTNRWKGDIAWEEATYSSMANTNNTVPAFTNAVVYLSGSTTAHDIAGVAGGRKGLRIRFYDSGTLPLTIRNLGGGASAGNRIRIRTGNDATLTNNPACFELDYSSTASEWNFIPLGN
jgi:hypothetical protein